jgi:protoheme IX farnesyltransferase
MTNQTTIVLEQPRAERLWAILSDYWALTKPEVNFLILIATSAGFYMGWAWQPQGFPFIRLLHTLVGTLLVASGAGTLNQYVERGFDSLMRRTRNRPLAAGRLGMSGVLWFGVISALAGAIYLAVMVGPLASLLSLSALVSYLFIYTPLKRRTPLCTFVGAFPGAMPILIGWAAGSGSLGGAAWALYAMLFLWQFPHCMAIAWIYRQDYARAGYLVLPSGPEVERVMAWTVLGASLGLVALSLSSVAGVILSAGYFYFSARLALRPSNIEARHLLTASIIYLPAALFVAMLSK